MPILAGWLTGEQVSPEIIEQTLTAMGEVLGRYGGQPAHFVQPGMGLITFSDPAYAMQRNNEAPVLDWVPDRRTLVYRRPLSGIHPLYYIENWPAEGNLLSASELKALFAVGVPRRLHLAALDTLSRYGFIPAPWTAFKDIYVVPAGSILRWQRAKTVVNHATDFHFEREQPLDDVLEHLHTLLNDTTAGLLPPHDRLVALTDGSAPSALVTILASQHTTVPFSVASLGYKKSTLSKIWKNAEQIAIACQRPFLAITGVDRPEFWTAALAGLEAPCVDTRPLALHELLHTVATETGVRVAISGLGSNILLLQSPQTDRNKRTNLTSPLTSPDTSNTSCVMPDRSSSCEPDTPIITPQDQTVPGADDILRWYSQGCLTHTVQSSSQRWSKDVAASLQHEKPWEQTLHALKLARQAAKFSNEAQAWYYLDLHLRLPDSIVYTPYQLAMQERMVIRSPYLQPDVINMLTCLPMRAENGSTRAALVATLLKRYLPASNDQPSLLPLSGPIASLQRIADSELRQQTLSPHAIRAIGIFDPLEVEKLLQKKGKAQQQRDLLLVFTTQLLYQLFQASL